ncbi:MAG: YabP/YqfC family sporulation protein [Oscillospiraceae bacterium]|nr:YabP/YqfC family sporulation protein [Oscillospiraceae bacterium]
MPRRKGTGGGNGISRAAGRALELFDMPLELAPGVSRLTVTGGSTVYVERHCGLAEYDDGMIAVKTRGGIVRFYGAELAPAAMNNDELLIKGSLERIEFELR